ncbi:hypothetical protein KP79_PYT15835 [Mizuhopecten yessoensis]|uniref:Uncharacterized protein n=1 Tax=Mizuhopecten yessoensis TaxID=6573 RepID=A0A210Q6F5_MIZYE|nr:hypothetical protein KP79_PYT15835 [Mizuhopecten yessoensis]
MMAANEAIRVCGERLRYIGDSMHTEYGQANDRWTKELSVYLVKVCGAIRVNVYLFNRLLVLALTASRTR